MKYKKNPDGAKCLSAKARKVLSKDVVGGSLSLDEVSGMLGAQYGMRSGMLDHTARSECLVTAALSPQPLPPPGGMLGHSIINKVE